MLSGSGTAIYFMRLRSDNLKNKYPPTTCAKDISLRKSDMGLWQDQAVAEYKTQ